jgi:hypothetical protein
VDQDQAQTIRTQADSVVIGEILLLVQTGDLSPEEAQLAIERLGLDDAQCDHEGLWNYDDDGVRYCTACGFTPLSSPAPEGQLA